MHLTLEISVFLHVKKVISKYFFRGPVTINGKSKIKLKLCVMTYEDTVQNFIYIQIVTQIIFDSIQKSSIMWSSELAIA